MGRQCTECLRIILVIYNFILVLIGLFILGCGIYAYIEPAAYDMMEASGRREITTPFIFGMAGIGSLTLIIALFGCCGAYHESTHLLGVYFGLLFLIFSSQLIVAVIGYFYRDNFLDKAVEQMQHGVYMYLQPVDELKRQTIFMNTIQKTLKCCGVRSVVEYAGTIPISCCKGAISSCNMMPIEPQYVYSDGCIDKYTAVVLDCLYISFLVIITISAFELFGLLFSIILCCSVRKSNADYNQVNCSVNT